MLSIWPEGNIYEPNSKHESEYTLEGQLTWRICLQYLGAIKPSEQLHDYYKCTPSPLELRGHKNVW